MFAARNLELNYASTPLFVDVNFQLQPGNRYGLVGANGAGKTTLLRLLSGELEPNAGSIERSADTRIGVLKQDHFSYEQQRIVDVVIEGKPVLARALKRKEELLALEDLDTKSAHELAAQEEIIYDEQGYAAFSEAEALLTGLGIASDKHYQPMAVLSGGYKLRVLLAQLLFNNPEIMLLDEPTNHLDIVSIAWLEQYLIDSFRGILVFISHDKFFLRRLATHILDIDYRTVLLYHCSYDKHLQEKALRYEQQQSEQANQQRQVDHLQHYIARFGAKASKAKQAQSKQKQLNRIEVTAVQETTRQAPAIAFNPKEKPGKLVLEVAELSHAFAATTIFANYSLQVGRGEKCAIIGANGLGKSTLMKILVGELTPTAGAVQWGAKTQLAYVAQDHHQALSQDISALEYLSANASGATSQQVRNILGQMLFKKDDVHKSVKQLSGGEAARLLLGQMMLSGANVLLLDEPTNHLDMESVEALADALVATQATVIVISHDRAFLQRVAKRLFVVTKDGIEDFNGTYQDYQASAPVVTAKPALVSASSLASSQKVSTIKPKDSALPSTKTDKAVKQQLRKAEQQIEQLEAELAELQKQLACPNLYAGTEAAKIAELNQALSKVELSLQEAYAVWEGLQG